MFQTSLQQNSTFEFEYFTCAWYILPSRQHLMSSQATSNIDCEHVIIIDCAIVFLKILFVGFTCSIMIAKKLSLYIDILNPSGLPQGANRRNSIFYLWNKCVRTYIWIASLSFTQWIIWYNILTRNRLIYTLLLLLKKQVKQLRNTIII